MPDAAHLEQACNDTPVLRMTHAHKGKLQGSTLLHELSSLCSVGKICCTELAGTSTGVMCLSEQVDQRLDTPGQYLCRQCKFRRHSHNIS